MNIIIKTVPHQGQRYDTIGDWLFLPGGDLVLSISDMGDWKKELLVAVHELVEAALCKDRCIEEEDVSNFDKKFEKIRRLYPDIIGNQEPGDMTSAPYNKEHEFATSIEKMLSIQLGVDWNHYSKVIESK